MPRPAGAVAHASVAASDPRPPGCNAWRGLLSEHGDIRQKEAALMKSAASPNILFYSRHRNRPLVSALVSELNQKRGYLLYFLTIL